MKQGADFSPCRVWRYSLWRIWEESKPVVSFIGLNPSTADEVKNDPTVKRCINYAHAWGYGGMYMLNIFGYRATDPKDMKAVRDPVGPEFMDYFLHYVDCSQLIVAAWGTHGAYRNRGNQIIETVTKRAPLHCLRVTKNGFPNHPLYLGKDLQPILFKEEKQP
jgi:hypothetical protein